MYQEVHKWEDVLRVAKKAQHPDAAALRTKYFDWLVSTQQFDKAGSLRDAEGKTNEAISLFLSGGFPNLAAQVVLRHPERTFEPEVVSSISAALVKAGMLEMAGEFFEGLGNHDEAMESFRRGKAYRRCRELAAKYNPQAVVALEEEWGDWLAAQKQWDLASNHYIEAGRIVKAMEAALEARQWSKAAQLAETQSRDVAEPYFVRIAEKYRDIGSMEDAERMYVRAGRAPEAVEMYLQSGRYDNAHKVAMGNMTDSEIDLLYQRRARELEAEHRYREAERLYVSVRKHDVAIHMYKRHKMYEPLLRLVSAHRKDLLQETLKAVAEQLGKETRFKEAEKYYVEAKEWKMAVHMYREQGLWDDALRVAKTFGGGNAAKQVAYARAVALGPQDGAAYLFKLGLVEQAISFAIESGAFPLAFEYTRAHAPQKVGEVHLKYAMFLEDEGKFTDAEAEFVQAGKPREAIDMYIHQQDWAAARRVAEQSDPDSVPEVLCGQANVFVDRKEYGQAEQLYLTAKRPDLALRMYREARLLDKALQIASEYLPGKAQEIRSEIQQQRGGGGGGGGGSAGRVGEIIAQARGMERAQNYAGAIQQYLSLGREHTEDVSVLEEAWERAVALAQGYVRDRVPEIVASAADKLVKVGRPDAAAELYQGIQDLQGELEVWTAAQMYDRARERARGNAAMEQFVTDQERIQQLRAGMQSAPSDSDASLAQALDYHHLKGDTAQVQQLVLKDLGVKMRQSDFVGAAAMLIKYAVPVKPEALDAYRTLAKEILSLPADQRSFQAEQNLQKILLKVVQGLEATSKTSPQLLKEFRQMHQAAHFLALATVSAKQGLKELAAMQATALLRYIQFVPADKAFYEAGNAWRALGGRKDNMAFVMLNKFLDIQEALEEARGPGATVTLENADLIATDIPLDFPLPVRPYVPEHKVEDVREWILTVSMRQDVEQALSERKCGTCKAATYEASLTCHTCKASAPMCWASGFPIVDRVQCTADARHEANRPQWNAYVEKFEKCPVCETTQPASY